MGAAFLAGRGSRFIISARPFDPPTPSAFPSLSSSVPASHASHPARAAAAHLYSLPAVPAPAARRRVTLPPWFNPSLPLSAPRAPRVLRVEGPKFSHHGGWKALNPEGRTGARVGQDAALASPVSPAAPWRTAPASGRARGRRRSPPAGRAPRAESLSRSRSRRAGSAAARTTWFAILCCPNSACSGSLCACRPFAPAVPGTRRGHRSAGSPSAWCSEASETPRAYIFSARHPAAPSPRAPPLSGARSLVLPSPPNIYTLGSDAERRSLECRWTIPLWNLFFALQSPGAGEMPPDPPQARGKLRDWRSVRWRGAGGVM